MCEGIIHRYFLRLPGERGCNPIGMSENGGEFSSVSESFRSHIPICDRYSGANFRKISAANQSNRAFSATTHGKSQLDYTLESRDPFIRLLGLLQRSQCLPENDRSVRW